MTWALLSAPEITEGLQSVCVCMRACVHAGVERWPGIYFAQQFSPCMRWGVVHLLNSFSCLALTWSARKVIQAAWGNGEGWGEEPKGGKGLGGVGKEGRAFKETEVGWEKSTTFSWVSSVASQLFIAPGSAIPPSGRGVLSDIYLFTQFRVCVMWQVVLGVAGFIRGTV